MYVICEVLLKKFINCDKLVISNISADKVDMKEGEMTYANH